MIRKNDKLNKINLDKIEEDIKLYIEGKHGKIGLIFPETPATKDEWESFNREIALILFKGL